MRILNLDYNCVTGMYYIIDSLNLYDLKKRTDYLGDVNGLFDILLKDFGINERKTTIQISSDFSKEQEKILREKLSRVSKVKKIISFEKKT